MKHSSFYKQFKIKIKQFLRIKVSFDEIVYSYVDPKFDIIDAGANDGSDSRRLAELTNGTVYAFEPVPEIYNSLVNKTADVENIETFEAALADQTGNMSMFVSGGGSDASSSLLEPNKHLEKNPEVTFSDRITVKTFSLDDWAKQHGIKKIDFMWLDMQGYEYQMLKASKEIFSTLKVLYTEVSTIELYSDQGLYAEYKNWLYESGFKLVKEDLSWEFTGNALFTKK